MRFVGMRSHESARSQPKVERQKMRGMHPMKIERVNSLLWTVFAASAGLVWIALSASAQSRSGASQSRGSSSEWRQKDTEWASYTADIRGTRYRPLDQLNASNFNKVEVAWSF